MRFGKLYDNNTNGNNSILELDRLKEILNNKVKEKKNQIHPLHAKVYDDNLQIEIRSLRWLLEQLTSKRQINQVRSLVEKEIKNLEIKMKVQLDMGKRDVLITEVEILLWVLFAIQSIEEKVEASNKLIM